MVGYFFHASNHANIINQSDCVVDLFDLVQPQSADVYIEAWLKGKQHQVENMILFEGVLNSLQSKRM